jgi:hypothetical protein
VKSVDRSPRDAEIVARSRTDTDMDFLAGNAATLPIDLE